MVVLTASASPVTIQITFPNVFLSGSNLYPVMLNWFQKKYFLRVMLLWASQHLLYFNATGGIDNLVTIIIYSKHELLYLMLLSIYSVWY